MYSVSDYGGMIADCVRMRAYEVALRASVQPGSVVVDVGAGTGIFSLIACRLGARRVFAIEPAPVIELARQAAAANGFDDRIVCIQDLSTNVTLPERADVLVSDLRGVLPLHEQHIASVAHARRHLLKPGGVQIPRSDTLWVAPAEAPEAFAGFAGGWDGNGWDLDLRAARRVSLNSWHRVQLRPDQLLADPHCWATLDYRTVETPSVTGTAHWSAARDGMLHGLTLWFDAVLADDAGFSNAPGQPELVYGQAFFPLEEPVEIGRGDEIEASLGAHLVSGEYLRTWTTRIRRDGADVVSFRQSTFQGVPLSPTSLHKRAADHVPVRNEDGDIDHLALSSMGTSSLEAIARRLVEAYPHRFKDWRQALTRVAALSARYSK